jgi:HPt (histidine-containing phosphotransfer) domain-containing protein
MLRKFDIPEELFPLVPDFLRRREEDIMHLHQALKEKNYQVILFIGHQLKGIGSSYGFDDISLTGEHLECASRSQNDKELEFWTNHLESIVRDLIKEVLPSLKSD